MKKLFFLFVAALMAATTSFAQNSGLGFNYQAVVRNADGMLLANSDVTLRISLYPGQSATSASWVETHKVKTDASGSFGITVGKGTRQSNSVASRYSDVNFAAVYYWMKIEVQEGSDFREISFAALPSSPYSEVAHNSSTFAGMIAPFAGPSDKVPAGWLLCDGREVSRSDYQNLYTAIGVAWGKGNGSTTFNLPDLRGMFLRGVSGDSKNDSDAEKRGNLTNNGGNTGNNVGSSQGDAIRNITGKVNGSLKQNWCDGAFYHIDPREPHYGSDYSGRDGDHSRAGFDASRVVPVGSDNRPKNVYVTYIIKY